VTLWAEDEHRLGLLPLVRRVWAPVGDRPIAAVQRRYQWLYVYGFVRPQTGQTWWCLLPAVRTAAFGVALAEFAHDEGIKADYRAVLVLDNAGWHHAKDLAIPEGIDLIFLPPYAPELQPAERLWPLINEPIANRVFPDLDALAQPLVDRCRTLRRQREIIRANTRFHWWPDEPARSNN
jgi:transposase